MFAFIYSNSNVPHNVLQTLKKQCNPLLKKSFKERNPDVDMDEIQNNPNVPEDVKAAITGALSLTLEEDDAEGVETCDEGLPNPDIMETFDDDYIMMSDDDGKTNRRKRVDENDEDWLTGRRKGAKPRKAKRKHKKRSKNRSENGDKERTKKRRSKKPNDVNGSLNSTLDTTLGSSTLNSTLNNTNTSFSGCENLNNSLDSATNRTMDSSHFDPMRKENKPKKSSKKRDSTEKPVNGIVKKTSRRQFSSISAIMACIEAVVQGNDASIPDTQSDIAVKTETIDRNDSFTAPEILSPTTFVKLDSIKIESIDAKLKTEPKKKPRRRSTNVKTKDALNLGNPVDMLLDKSAVKISSVSKTSAKKSQANGTAAKQSKTSMKKVKFIS